MSSDSGKSNKTWWIHIDLTSICIIAGLLVAGWGIKSYITYLHEKENVAAERAKKEREEREKVEEAKRAEEAETRRVEEDAKAERLAAERKVREAEAAARQARIQAERERLGLEERKAAEAAREQFEKDRKKAEQDEAERQRLATDAERLAEQARKQKEITDAKVTVSGSSAEIEELTKRMEAARGKMTAYKNAMDFEKKKADGALTAQYRAAEGNYERATSEYGQMDRAIADARARRESAAAVLKGYGVDAAAPAALPGPRPVAPPSAGKVYVMKDGRRILALKAVEAGDTISVKTESGKFETINKADVEKIEDPK